MARYNDANLPAPPPMPETSRELQEGRKVARPRSLNDEVDDIVDRLYGEEEHFRKLLAAVWRRDTVHGGIIYDDVAATQMIHEFAVANGGFPQAAEASLARLHHALKVVLNRLQRSREQRRKEALRQAGQFQQAAE